MIFKASFWKLTHDISVSVMGKKAHFSLELLPVVSSQEAALSTSDDSAPAYPTPPHTTPGRSWERAPELSAFLDKAHSALSSAGRAPPSLSALSLSKCSCCPIDISHQKNPSLLDFSLSTLIPTQPYEQWDNIHFFFHVLSSCFTSFFYIVFVITWHNIFLHLFPPGRL